MDSELQELVCIPVFVSGTWIPIFSGIPDSLSCIPDSKAHDSGFYKEIFPDCESLIWAIEVPGL